VEAGNKIGISDNRGNWNHLRMFQEVPEHYTGKGGYQATKKTILYTAHMYWKVLMERYKTFIMGNSITCTMNCSHRIGVKLCTLEA